MAFGGRDDTSARTVPALRLRARPAGPRSAQGERTWLGAAISEPTSAHPERRPGERSEPGRSRRVETVRERTWLARTRARARARARCNRARLRRPPPDRVR